MRGARAYSTVTLLLLAGCVPAARVAPKTAVPARATVVLRSTALAAPEPGAEPSQKLTTRAGSYAVEYEFDDARGERVSLKFEVAKSALTEAEAAFGYTEKELAAIKNRHEAARAAALKAAVERQLPQDRLDAEVRELQARYTREVREYLSSRGFRLEDESAVQVDMPSLVRRAAPSVASAASALERLAKAKGYAPAESLETALAMVQTGILYVPVPAIAAGAHTGGIWPPAKTLVTGRGDCDTKAGLLASLLAHRPETRLIGITLPGHYILGVRRQPSDRESYVVFEGREYVLIEAAGPARLPAGQIGQDAESEFRAQSSYKIETLF